jgi:hypothetical protein
MPAAEQAAKELSEPADELFSSPSLRQGVLFWQSLLPEYNGCRWQKQHAPLSLATQEGPARPFWYWTILGCTVSGCPAGQQRYSGTLQAFRATVEPGHLGFIGPLSSRIPLISRLPLFYPNPTLTPTRLQDPAKPLGHGLQVDEVSSHGVSRAYIIDIACFAVWHPR